MNSCLDNLDLNEIYINFCKFKFQIRYIKLKLLLKKIQKKVKFLGFNVTFIFIE